MTDRYERIRAALAMGPTPGEWYWSDAYPTQDGRKTWSLIGDGGFGILSCDGDENSPQSVNAAAAELIAACDPDTIRELLAERDRLAAENARLREALHVVSECGDPCNVILYDEEGIEGWRWTHPDGREWTETGEWCEDPPLHPVARAALSAAERADGRTH